MLKRPLIEAAQLLVVVFCAFGLTAKLARQESTLESGYVISGNVVDPDQRLTESGALLLRGPAEGSARSIPVSIRPDGAFTTPRVSPGTYVLDVKSELSHATLGRIVGFEIVRVGVTDVSGATVRVRRDTAITGRFRMESDNPLAKPPPSIVVSAFLALDGMPFWHSTVADSGPDGTFVLRNAFGPRVLRCGYTLVPGHSWSPSRVILDGLDVTNVPTDFSKHDGGRLEIVFTQNPSRITGIVTDAKGLPESAPWIVVNGVDQAVSQLWSTTSDVTRADVRGKFSIALLPGVYRVRAMPADTFDSWSHARKRVLEFALDGTTVVLQEREAKRVTLTVREP